MDTRVGFLIDTVGAVDTFKRSLRDSGLRFDDTPYENVVSVSEADRDRVVELAQLHHIEWQWTD